MALFGVNEKRFAKGDELVVVVVDDDGVGEDNRGELSNGDEAFELVVLVLLLLAKFEVLVVVVLVVVAVTFACVCGCCIYVNDGCRAPSLITIPRM